MCLTNFVSFYIGLFLYRDVFQCLVCRQLNFPFGGVHKMDEDFIKKPTIRSIAYIRLGRIYAVPHSKRDTFVGLVRTLHKARPRLGP